MARSDHGDTSPPLRSTPHTERLLCISAPAASALYGSHVVSACQSTSQVVRLEAGKICRMDTLDYVLLIGGILVFIFTIVMDVLLVREWIRRRRDKQKPPEPSDK